MGEFGLPGNPNSELTSRPHGLTFPDGSEGGRDRIMV